MDEFQVIPKGLLILNLNIKAKIYMVPAGSTCLFNPQKGLLIIKNRQAFTWVSEGIRVVSSPCGFIDS